MEKLYVGKIVFFKDGKELELPLSYSDLSDYNFKVKQSLLSKEEAKFLSFQLGTTIKQGESFDAKLYEKIIKQGFSIIRVMPFIKGGNIIPGETLVTSYISDKVQESDAVNFANYVRKLEANTIDSKLSEQIYVDDKKRYYYYERSIGKGERQAYTGENHDNAVDLFLKYKTGRLSPNEAKLMEKYFNFDMQDVFLADTQELPLSHKNAAVILISQRGKRYSATKKMEQHRLEATEMLKEILGQDIKDDEVDVLSKKFNMVIMRIYKTDRNAVAIYCPEKMTVPQIDELVKCMNEFNGINLMLKLENKPEILPLIGGNEYLETDYAESNGIEMIRQKAIEYENKQKAGLVGTGINWVATSVSNITRYLGRLKRNLVPEEPSGR